MERGGIGDMLRYLTNSSIMAVNFSIVKLGSKISSLLFGLTRLIFPNSEDRLTILIPNNR